MALLVLNTGRTWAAGVVSLLYGCTERMPTVLRRTASVGTTTSVEGGAPLHRQGALSYGQYGQRLSAGQFRDEVYPVLLTVSRHLHRNTSAMAPTSQQHSQQQQQQLMAASADSPGTGTPPAVGSVRARSSGSDAPGATGMMQSHPAKAPSLTDPGLATFWSGVLTLVCVRVVCCTLACVLACLYLTSVRALCR